MALNKFTFDQYLRNFKDTKNTLPRKVGVIAKNHYLLSWRNQGFTDQTIDPWAQRKRADKGRAILVKSGALRASIRVRSATFDRIRVGSYGIPYARIHNRGEGPMPVRQFVGPSDSMNRKIKRQIGRELKSVFK